MPPAIWILFGAAVIVPGLLVAITALRVLRDESIGVRTRLNETCANHFVVVFGAEANQEGPSPELQSRLDHAYLLWSNNLALSILVSGGIANGVDEVTVMRRYLMHKGVPEHSIGEVRPGNTTRATIGAVRDLGVERALAVSSSYHCHRIRCEGNRRQLKLVPSCPAQSPETARPATHRAQRVTEVIASLWYALPKTFTSQVETGPGSLRHRLPRILGGDTAHGRTGNSVPAVGGHVGASEH